MASTQKIRLMVKDDDGMVVVDDEIECSATGEQLFNEMNRRCEFRKWEGPYKKSLQACQQLGLRVDSLYKCRRKAMTPSTKTVMRLEALWRRKIPG